MTPAAYVGEPVTIRYDPRDLAEIRVFHQGKFLCRAVSPEIVAASISIKDLQAARNQRRRELRQHLTSRRSLVDLLTAGASVAEAGANTSMTNAEEPVRPRVNRLKIYRED